MAFLFMILGSTLVAAIMANKAFSFNKNAVYKPGIFYTTGTQTKLDVTKDFDIYMSETANVMEQFQNIYSPSKNRPKYLVTEL